MDGTLIKVVDQSLAKKLAEIGFQYIREGFVFAFVKSDELVSAIQKTYSNGNFICENKLRF